MVFFNYIWRIIEPNNDIRNCLVRGAALKRHWKDGISVGASDTNLWLGGTKIPVAPMKSIPLTMLPLLMAPVTSTQSIKVIGPVCNNTCHVVQWRNTCQMHKPRDDTDDVPVLMWLEGHRSPIRHDRTKQPPTFPSARFLSGRSDIGRALYWRFLDIPN